MALIRLHVCAGWSEALLVAHTALLEIPCHGSYLEYGPAHKSLILIAFLSNECWGESVHIQSMDVDVESDKIYTSSFAGYLSMSIFGGFCVNANFDQ